MYCTYTLISQGLQNALIHWWIPEYSLVLSGLSHLEYRCPKFFTSSWDMYTIEKTKKFNTYFLLLIRIYIKDLVWFPLCINISLEGLSGLWPEGLSGFQYISCFIFYLQSFWRFLCVGALGVGMSNFECTHVVSLYHLLSCSTFAISFKTIPFDMARRQKRLTNAV